MAEAYNGTPGTAWPRRGGAAARSWAADEAPAADRTRAAALTARRGRRERQVATPSPLRLLTPHLCLEKEFIS